MRDPRPTVEPFPHSRVAPGRTPEARDLGLTELSRHVDAGGRSPRGHWCSRCRGIWYSFFLEAECPVCHNRHG